jgi:hypothetical protein
MTWSFWERLMANELIARMIRRKGLRKELRRRSNSARTALEKRGYASYQEAHIAEVQRAFERARRGEGLFGLKDADQRH